MAVITDVGDEADVHPKQKTPVGIRLALAARAIAYGEPIEYSGPEYASMKVEGDAIVLSFTHLTGGLEAKDGPLKGFAIAGADHAFVNAEAEIKGDAIVVRSPRSEDARGRPLWLGEFPGRQPLEQGWPPRLPVPNRRPAAVHQTREIDGGIID